MLIELLSYDLKNYAGQKLNFFGFHLVFVFAMLINYFVLNNNTKLSGILILLIITLHSFAVLKIDTKNGVFVNYKIANISLLSIVFTKLILLIIINSVILGSGFLLFQ
jgi:hypothetical protein